MILFLADDSGVYLIPHPKRHCQTAEGSVYRSGDTWRVSACQSCACQDDGQIHCYSQTCPALSCNKSVLKKGQCCPYCLGKN